MRICKYASATAEFPFPYSPVGKNSLFNVPKHIFWYDDGENTVYYHTAYNEAMKLIFLLFNGFHRMAMCQFTFNPIQDGRRGSAKRFLAGFPQHF